MAMTEKELATEIKSIRRGLAQLRVKTNAALVQAGSMMADIKVKMQSANEVQAAVLKQLGYSPLSPREQRQEHIRKLFSS